MDEHKRGSDSGYASPASIRSSSSRDPLSRSTSPILDFPTESVPTLTAEHMKLKMRLSPLLQVEQSLWRRLSPTGAANLEGTHLPESVYHGSPAYLERSINSNNHWKDAFGRLIPGNSRPSLDENAGIDFDDPNDPGVILHNCAEDMIMLWSDPTIKELLRIHKITMEDTPGL